MVCDFNVVLHGLSRGYLQEFVPLKGLGQNFKCTVHVAGPVPQNIVHMIVYSPGCVGTMLTVITFPLDSNWSVHYALYEEPMLIE